MNFQNQLQLWLFWKLSNCIDLSYGPRADQLCSTLLWSSAVLVSRHMWLLQKISYLPFVMTAPHGHVSLSFSTMDLKPFRNLVWIIMILLKKIITFVQILRKSNIRGKSCEILWGLKFTYLEKMEFTKFWIRIDKFFELIVISSAFSLSYSTRFSELNPLTLEWCGIYFLNIDLESLVCW